MMTTTGNRESGIGNRKRIGWRLPIADCRFPAFSAAVLSLITLTAACADKTGPAQQVAEAPPPETVYVQQPPPPPPPPAPLAVSPRSLLFDAIGDTARLAMPEGSQCAIASVQVAQVDSAGLITATGNGDTHLRCWEGVHHATVRIEVAQALARVSVVADPGLAIARPGDSVRLSLARVDRRGAPVESARPVWESLAPAVISVDATTGVAVGLVDTGTARIVGRADGLADTVIMEVGFKGQASSLLSSTGRVSRSRTAARVNQRAGRIAGSGTLVTQAANSTGGAPQVQTPLGIGVRQARVSDSLFRDPQLGTLGRRRVVVPWVTAGFGEHRIDIPTTAGGLGLEKTSGAIYGGGADILTGGVLSFRFQFMTGTLTSDTATASDRTVYDGSFDAGLNIAPWLTVLAGGEARTYETIATERWLMLRVGGEASFSLGGGPLRGIARIFLMPLVSLASSQSTPTAPSFGVQSRFGLGFENRTFSSSLTYDIERYSFPSNTSRREQFAALMFKLGYKFSW